MYQPLIDCNKKTNNKELCLGLTIIAIFQVIFFTIIYLIEYKLNSL